MKQAVFAHVAQFMRQVQIELRKVEWPSPMDFAGSAAVVFIIVALFSAFFGVFDALVSRVVQFILQWNGSL